MEPELKFEKALERLEKIVEDLESGTLTLEEALKRYEEGVKLSRLCTQKLAQAENKIEVLTKSLNHSLESSASDLTAELKSAERKKMKKPAANDVPVDENLLL